MELSFKTRNRFIVVGHARHGKDTVGDILADRLSLTAKSSSMVAAEKVVMPYLERFKGITYDSVEAAYADRVNYRSTWYDAIVEFNTPDKTKLAREIFKDSSIYVGLRSQKELWAIKAAGLVDFVIWVDALDRLPPESPKSMTIQPWEADFHIDNNGSLEETIFQVETLAKRF